MRLDGLFRRAVAPFGLAVLATLAVGHGARADEPPPVPGDERPGAILALEPPRWNLALSLGAGAAYGQSYFLLGGLVDYRLAGGLSIGLEGQYWFGGAPGVGELAPRLTYTLWLPGGLSPYLGAFYARWFAGGGLPDQSAVGARIGVLRAMGGRAIVGFGIAYERVLACSLDCDVWFPEGTIAFGF